MQDSIWFQTLDPSLREELFRSDPLPESAEVVIIGAGLSGLSTAYYLTEAGVRDVCVLDRGPALSEASGANAGGLWFAQQSSALGAAAPLARISSDLYDELASRFDFDIDRCGLLELLPEESGSETERRLEPVRGAGFRAQRLSGKETRSLEPGLGVTPPGALYYPDEGHLHTGKFGAALVRHLRANGVRICPGCDVIRLAPEIVTAQGTVTGARVAITAGAWTPQITTVLGWQPPIKPVRGTLVALDVMPKTLHHTLIGREFYFWQLKRGNLAGGGSVDDVGFQQGVEPDTVARIRAEMNRLIPAAEGRGTLCAWSGFRPFCEDLKPVIGRVPHSDKMFVAAGHFKKGVMMAPITGKILADLITAGNTQFDIRAVDPGRFPVDGKSKVAPESPNPAQGQVTGMGR
jgi:glycine oxidase